ncbi:MAG: SH3 domain-containing protein [Acidobacteria bacterium]|nr:SH3 domain-containing protein [Acidobacteriota bacterium]
MDTAALVELQHRLEEEREAHAIEHSRALVLARSLDESRAAFAVAEERAMALEIELASAIEEVLRSKASVRSVQSRALATSRIAEVRVALQSARRIEDAEVTVRLERAGGLLARADEALDEENYSGAAYLAEKASDLVRQARTVTEVQSSIPGHADLIVPLVPPRAVAPTQRTNLREGPDLTFDRLKVLGVGEPLVAVARSGQWLQIECCNGLRGWVHSRLVSEPEAAD